MILLKNRYYGIRFYCKKRHLKTKNGLEYPSRRIFSFQRKYLITFGVT
jgi:hypothetical protein